MLAELGLNDLGVVLVEAPPGIQPPFQLFDLAAGFILFTESAEVALRRFVVVEGRLDQGLRP